MVSIDTDGPPRARTSTRSPSGREVALPGVWSTGLARGKVELKAFFRNRQSLVFTLLFPILLLVILGSIFTGTIDGTDIDFRLVFISGIIAAGVMSVAFSGLAISIALERDLGMLRRLASTPMPKSAYFAGKIIRVSVTVLLEIAVLLAIAVLAFGLSLPSDASQWLTFGWVLLLGTTSCAMLAVAYSSLIPNSASAAAIVTPPFIALQFISGVFFPFSRLPDWMQTLASFFPLKWMAQGFRSVFLPDSFQYIEPAGSWELPRIALVLVGWTVAMLVVSLLTFRWKSARVR